MYSFCSGLLKKSHVKTKKCQQEFEMNVLLDTRKKTNNTMRENENQYYS